MKNLEANPLDHCASAPPGGAVASHLSPAEAPAAQSHDSQGVPERIAPEPRDTPVCLSPAGPVSPKSLIHQEEFHYSDLSRAAAVGTD